MNMEKLQLGLTLKLLRQTMPILLVRLGASLLFWLVALIYIVVVGGISLLVMQAVEIVGVILLLVAFIGIIPLYRLAYRYVFFMIKAAHIAVISELLVNGRLPEGEGQLAWGRQRVQERFGEINVMFVVDEVVGGVVRLITRTFYSIGSILPGDTLKTLISIINRVIYFATNYIDEAIMARSFYRRSDAVWDNARDGVTLYAMVWKSMLINAVVLMIISYIPFVVAAVLFAAPIGFLIATVNPTLAGWSIIATLVLAWLVKAAIGDSFAMTAMIATYQRETADKKPDPQIVARLDSMSDKFRDLRDRITQEIEKAEHKPETAAGDPAAPEAPEADPFAPDTPGAGGAPESPTRPQEP